MKRAYFYFLVFMFLSVDSFASHNLKDLIPAQRNYVTRYIQAVNIEDEDKLKELMHPSYLQCINDSNKDYFQEMFQRSFSHDIPRNYKVSIKALTEEMIFKENKEAREGGLSYPVKPTHQLRIDFAIGGYSSVTIIRKLVQEGDLFYEVSGCPSTEAVNKFRQAKIKKDAERLRAKELFKELKNPLFSELRILLKQGRKIDALKKYSKVTGETLAVAKEVLSYMQINK